MEEEGSINFKALRAKFQEEGLLPYSKSSRPAVAEKPKLLQGHSSSAVSCIGTAVADGTPEISRVFFRDGLRSPGGKRPISFPPNPKQTSPSSQLASGDGSAKHPLKDWYMPLVLPVPPVKDHKVDAPTGKEQKLEAETRKEAFSHTKIKKKGLLLPFKSIRASKIFADNGEELTSGDLPSRPCNAPSDFSSMDKQGSEERPSLQSDQSTTEYVVSSPEFIVSPPSPDTRPDSDNRILSTLEKAKKKLSRRQIAILPKPKGLRSLDYSCTEKTFPKSPKNLDRLGSDVLVPPSLSLPHLACLSARPFCKANSSARRPSFDKHLMLDKASQVPVRTSEPYLPQSPLKKLLPELWTLGPVPVKPPRPSTVDLSSYHAVLAKGKETLPGWCQTPKKEAVSVLDAPDVPDFETSELEAAEAEPVDIAALEMQASDIVVGNPVTPNVLEATDYGGSDSALAVCEPRESNSIHIVQDLNLGTSHIIPLDPASFPEPINLLEFPELPERRSYSEDAAVDSFLNSRTDEIDVGATEQLTVPEETEFLDQPTPNHKTQTQPREQHQSCYYETCDNIYEDVEINKQLSNPTLTKQKSRLRNPYADSQLRKGEACLHKRPRHPWQCTSPYTAEHKEQKKREKQRLEKERKEQKEREKKENEMKKKFKVTGEEEPMYHAKVMVASKVRKNDLPVRNGDTVSIIRTTNCPKGKWLARDANLKYGYISVMNVELNIKDMLELGKKAQAAGRGAYVEPDTISIGSRYLKKTTSMLALITAVCFSTVTDDSEEWACEDETLSQSYESHFAQQTVSEPEMSCVHVDAQLTVSDSNPEDQHTQTRHEALQKLALLVQHGRDGDGGATPTNADASSFLCAVEEPPYPEKEIDFTEMELLPPPPLYADAL
ncbi:uncharacterized protein si:ch211-188c16.1 [Poeciliopsis prolifica]|uniref:uncharacterized protein si:ch211-188c16.1 n=1 Tax=Poeciliopsis prolifica TaxID=188132 RepID=UPI002413ADCF|nr:uncharacterized protein si:ch211-188c16.1 [Poeciliopsis prolifica]